MYHSRPISYRDVSAGATGATAVASKFSDILTLSQLGGGKFCPPSQRSNLNFTHGYVPVIVAKLNSFVRFLEEAST